MDNVGCTHLAPLAHLSRILPDGCRDVIVLAATLGGFSKLGGCVRVS
jgi:hypothetical protein